MVFKPEMNADDRVAALENLKSVSIDEISSYSS